MAFTPLKSTTSSGFTPYKPSSEGAALNNFKSGLQPTNSAIHPDLQNALSAQNLGETNLQAAETTLKNIPSSVLNFGKGVLESVNPLHVAGTLSSMAKEFSALKNEAGGTGKAIATTAKELPGAAYKTLVPQFLQHLIKGDLTNAQSALESDPIGQIAPLILLARGAAEGLGKGAAFDSSLSDVLKPVTAPLEKVAKTASEITGKVGAGVKNTASETLGLTTGAGGEAIRKAFGAGTEAAKTPGGGQAFTEAMRGNTSPSEIVNKAQDALQTIKENQGSDYRTRLQEIKGQKGSLDISPLGTELQKQLTNFGIKATKDGLDFSRSTIGNDPAAMNAVKAAYDDVQNWGTKAGDRTALGLDTLKRRLDDLYSPTKQSRAFTQALKGTVRATLSKQVPGYDVMTKNYEDTFNLIDDIKSATSLGGKASADTVFKKLTSALKQNQDLRLEMTKALEDKSGQKVLDEVAGENLNSVLPRGLVGKGADLFAAVAAIRGALNPGVLIELALTSPRVMGEFVRGLGYATEKTSQILKDVTKVRGIIKASSQKEP